MAVSDLKEELHRKLKASRAVLLSKLDNLSEYDRRRPMTPTGTSLLGLVKHLAGLEYLYLGESFGYPAPESIPWVEDGSIWQGADMWARPDESSEYITGLYRRAGAHADGVIAALDLEAPGSVPHWPEDRRQTTLGVLLIRMVAETAQHAGHADIIRELIDGKGGPDQDAFDEATWREYIAQIQAAADTFRLASAMWRGRGGSVSGQGWVSMSSLAERISDFLSVPVTGIRQTGSQHGYRHVTGTLADGRSIFAKVAPGPDEAFAAEANGLRWLAEADGGPPVPEVIGVAAEFLVIELLPPPRACVRGAGPPARRRPCQDARRGRARPSARRGPGTSRRSRSTTPPALGAETDWGSWYAERRLVPYLSRAHDDGAMSRADASLVEAVIGRISELAGPPEPPSRIHGDLWSGNVLWPGGRGA